MIRRALIVTSILALSALLAFPLRSSVYEVVIVPISYLLWALGLFYHALPQFVWWIVLTALILYIFVRNIFSEIKFTRRREQRPTPPKGQVEQLSEWMHKSETGIYNRWLVANRLGRLAYRILVQRDSGRVRSFFAPLDGPDWNASPNLTGYLQAGLHGSFADYPNQNNPFIPPVKTPLDHDIREAVEFLETKIDNSIR
jgi:hypothetical protein